jgi:predicted metal-binding protein
MPTEAVTETTTEVIVCTTCRPAGAPRELPAAGLVLYEAVMTLQTAGHAAGLQLRGIACLSGCSRVCTVALQAPGKPTYYFGDLSADAETAAQVLVCAQLHAQRADGALPRNERPERLRSGILAKLPAYAGASPAEAA